MYRVIEIPLQVKEPPIGKFIKFLLGNFIPRFQAQALHLELESTINQIAQQGYFLLCSSVKAGKKGQSETILLIFNRL